MQLLGVIETQNLLLTAPAKPKTSAVAKPKFAAKPKLATALKKTTKSRKHPKTASKGLAAISRTYRLLTDCNGSIALGQHTAKQSLDDHQIPVAALRCTADR